MSKILTIKCFFKDLTTLDQIDPNEPTSNQHKIVQLSAGICLSRLNSDA